MLNQSGVYPQAPKTAVVTNSPAASKFYVISADQKDTVFSASLGDESISYAGNLLSLDNGEIQGTGRLDIALADAGGLARIVGFLCERLG